MTLDNIQKLAAEAGLPMPWIAHSGILKWIELERFAALVAAIEREECAKMCEVLRDDWRPGLGRYEFMSEGAGYCAGAIRARGKR